jgi:lysophospholipase L1-like esterase
VSARPRAGSVGGGGASLPVKLALAPAAVLALLAALEGGARVAGVSIPPGTWPSALTCVQRSALLGQEFRPHCSGKLASTAFSTNALGLRGGELRDDRAKRILALGDSCTWGWAVGDDATYPALLEQALDARRNGYQVINAGFPGHTSHQGLLFLRERGLALRPDIVIIAFGFNDRFATGEIGAALARNRTLLPLLRLDDFLMEWSLFYRWARYRPPGESTFPTSTARVTAEQYERNLTEMIRLVREQGSRPVLVSFLQPRRGLAFGPYVQAERRVERDTQVPVVGYDGPRVDVVHPTPEGYRAFVDALVKEMDAAGYLSDEKSVTGHHGDQ